jgi:ATP-dependent DNA helicase RecG
VPRNPLLVNALVRLRLVNRMNLGVRRMFQSML